MICVYDPFEADGLSLGEGVLSPLACTVREEAGGPYALTLTHPLTPDGLWRAIRPLALIRAPVPVCATPAVNTAENLVVDAGWQVWQVTKDRAGLYASTRSTRYAAFVNGNMYLRGDRVRHAGHNWQCTAAATLLTPSAANSGSWRDLGTGDPSPRAYLTLGEQLAVSDAGETWLEARRADGTRGYVRRSSCAYLYTAEAGAQLADPVAARVITDQLFRVVDVTVDSEAGVLTAHAMHLSYDASGLLLDRVTLADTDLPTAVAALRSAAMPGGAADAPCVFCQGTEAAVTGSYTRRSLVSALLDPEDGLVRQARARLVRDNRDFFLLRNPEAAPTVRLTYGVNLRGVRWRRGTAGLVTAYCPVAADEDGNDLLLPERLAASARAEQYPVRAIRPLRVPLRVGRDGWTEEQVLARMREEAQRRFLAGADLPAVTLTVRFLLLGDTEEYAQYRGLERVTLYDRVAVAHPDLGLTTVAQVKAYAWDALAQRYLSVTLGDVFDAPAHTVSGYDVADGSLGVRKLSPEAIEEIRSGVAGSAI